MARSTIKSPSNIGPSQGTSISTGSEKGTGGGIPAPHISQEAIAKRAYEKYVARGCEPGSEQQDWFEAEQELLAEVWGGKKQRR